MTFSDCFRISISVAFVCLLVFNFHGRINWLQSQIYQTRLFVFPKALKINDHKCSASKQHGLETGSPDARACGGRGVLPGAREGAVSSSGRPAPLARGLFCLCLCRHGSSCSSRLPPTYKDVVRTCPHLQESRTISCLWVLNSSHLQSPFGRKVRYSRILGIRT